VTNAPVRAVDTRVLILDATRNRLLADGYGGLSTRKVADEAGVPLSQLHYHFGSKQGLILALLEEENQRRLARQQRMYAEGTPLWQRYERACDFLEDDLDSGYVRVLHEMIAAGWSNQELGDAVRELVQGWFALLIQVSREAEQRYGALAPYTAAEIGTLVGAAFIGAEALLLLGFDRDVLPIRSALRRFSVLIREFEEGRAVSGRKEHATATSSATASRSFTKSSVAASQRSCCCRPGHCFTPATGRCRSLISRGTAV
jgi:AcrR family transcriptional regulator